MNTLVFVDSNSATNVISKFTIVPTASIYSNAVGFSLKLLSCPAKRLST